MPFLSPDFWRGLAALVYLLVAALVVLATFITIWRANPKNKWAWAWVPILILGFAYPPASAIYGKWRDEREFAAKSAAQIAHFEMRCKSAGEKIYQTVKGVDGIFIMKPRIKPTESLYQNQWELWDPYGTSLFEGVASKLPISGSLLADAREWQIRSRQTESIGYERYLFVEIPNNESKSHASTPAYIRYSYNRQQDGTLIYPSDNRRPDPETTSTLAGERLSKYGYTWDDISTREDREKWIAGGRLQVIELASGKVIAERVGYMREPGLGSTRHNRLSWSFATNYSCPPLSGEHDKDKNFLKAVLFPK